MLVYVKYYSRAMIRNHPECLFVFGDNLARVGLRGQAHAARGEPNAVGIATKIVPSNAPNAFLKDSMLEEWREAEKANFEQLRRFGDTGGIIVWPIEGIGTGLAQLQKHAPLLFDEIEKLHFELACIFR